MFNLLYEDDKYLATSFLSIYVSYQHPFAVTINRLKYPDTYINDSVYQNPIWFDVILERSRVSLFPLITNERDTNVEDDLEVKMGNVSSRYR